MSFGKLLAKRKYRESGASLVEGALLAALITITVMAAVPNTSVAIRRTTCKVMEMGLDTRWHWVETQKKCINMELWSIGAPNWLF